MTVHEALRFEVRFVGADLGVEREPCDAVGALGEIVAFGGEPVVELRGAPQAGQAHHQHGEGRIGERARSASAGDTDSQLVDEALAALLDRYRAAEIDAAYAVAYSAHPVDEPDEWGDLASFREAASR